MIKGEMILEQISNFLAEINNVDECMMEIYRDEYYTDDNIHIIIESLEDLDTQLKIAIKRLRTLYYGV
ncbi:hypothetical protein [Campylobacter sp.]|uniref:hypothetical protein n=1 Tax=Campylobacter sp. TaxID=205 RepID=UPI00259C95E2|nr:hypothetical protein [Campylobacter sp.]MBQ7135954.1 hypothetical protein [Campylobacter sp.]MBQ8609764.1 hypothetical protein [Campylobacter sp.]